MTFTSKIDDDGPFELPAYTDMKTFSFEKLRAEFIDASFVLTPYHSHFSGLGHDFSFDFSDLTINRAWQNLDKAKRLVDKIREEYPSGYGKRSIDQLTVLITDAYKKIAVETSTTGTKLITKTLEAEENDGFIF